MSEGQEIKGFCLQRGYSGREIAAVMCSVHQMGLKIAHESVCPEGWIPVGTVEFGEEVFGECRKDFYPEFLWDWIRRDVLLMMGPDVLAKPLFVKSALKWKSDWESGVYPSNTVLVKGLWLVSEPVTFVQEWRYYVANGRVVTTGWYIGHDDDEPAPDLGIEWPDGFSGAVDFGRLDDGRMALVECHAPFACGWYGERHEDYARWLFESWTSRDWWLTE